MPYNLDIKGWMTQQELVILESWATGLEPGSTIVEIGSLYGRSSYCLAASAPEGSMVYCYDRWLGDLSDETIRTFTEDQIKTHGFPTTGIYNTHDYFIKNTESLKNIRSKKISDYTEIAWPHGRIVDLFFIDAAHENPSDWEYIDYWRLFVKKDGYICGHDYYPDSNTFPDICKNVKMLEEIYNTSVETYKNTSLWRIRASI